MSVAVLKTIAAAAVAGLVALAVWAMLALADVGSGPCQHVARTGDVAWTVGRCP